MKKKIYRDICILLTVFGIIVMELTSVVYAIAHPDDTRYIIVTLAPILIFILILSLGLGFFAANRLTKHIMKPINDIDLDNLKDASVYEELMPFLNRIEKDNEEREQAEKIRREFSANVSHELKTPLTSIYGYAQMITNNMAKPEDYHMCAEKIEKEASNLMLLIDDIIKLSHLDEIEVETDELIDLSEIARDTIMRLEPTAKKRGVQIFYSGEPAYINGSRTLIGELMYNLIDNAVKYNKENGKVTVFSGTTANKVEFSVRDTGIGIPEEAQERIFERFYRVDKSRSKTLGGTGLGLSIVKHAAICHNAEIKVRSKLGTGTSITVIFNKAQ